MLRTRSIQLGLLLALGLVSVAQANPADSLLTPEPALPAAADLPAMDVGEVSHLDFSAMDAAWWKAFNRACTRALYASDEEVQERAMQNMIYFTTFYPAEADFRRASPRALQIYLRDRDESRRILALATLNVVGDDEAMHHIARELQYEESEVARKVAVAVLSRHLADAR